MSRAVRIVLVVAILAQSWATWNGVRQDAAMRDGIEAYRSADVEHVRDGFATALEIDDRDPYLWAWAGDAAMYAYDYNSEGVAIDPAFGRRLLDEAWTAYAESVRRSPAYAWSWAGLAGVANRRVELERAERGLDLEAFGRLRDGIWDPMRSIALSAASTANALNPNGYQELDVLADVYMSAGQRDRATELLRRSASVMPAPSFHTWGIGQRLERGLYATVLDALQAGVRRAPAFEQSLLHLEIGDFARAQGDLATAVDEFRRAHEAARNDFWRFRALSEMSAVHQEAGDFEEAIETTLAWLATGYSVEAAHRRLATLYRLVGRFEEACDEYRAIRIGPLDGDAWRVAGALACRQAGRFDAAERMLLGGLVEPASQPELARTLIQLYVDSGQVRLARFRLDRWVEDAGGAEPTLERWRREFGFDEPLAR